jgi:Ulp1 family protease
MINAYGPTRSFAIRVSESRFFEAFDENPEVRRPLNHAVDLVFIPVTIRTGHWSLVVFRRSSNSYEVYDSFFPIDARMIERASKIARRFSQYYDVPRFNGSVVAMQECRFQARNSQDCGLHVVSFVRHIVVGEQVRPEDDMTTFRYQMRTAALLEVGVLDEDDD